MSKKSKYVSIDILKLIFIEIKFNKEEIHISSSYCNKKIFSGFEYYQILNSILENKLLKLIEDSFPFEVLLDGFYKDVNNYEIYDKQFNYEYNNPYYCSLLKVLNDCESPLYDIKKGDYLINSYRLSKNNRGKYFKIPKSEADKILQKNDSREALELIFNSYKNKR